MQHSLITLSTASSSLSDCQCPVGFFTLRFNAALALVAQLQNQNNPSASTASSNNTNITLPPNSDTEGGFCVPCPHDGLQNCDYTMTAGTAVLGASASSTIVMKNGYMAHGLSQDADLYRVLDNTLGGSGSTSDVARSQFYLERVSFRAPKTLRCLSSAACPGPEQGGSVSGELRYLSWQGDSCLEGAGGLACASCERNYFYDMEYSKCIPFNIYFFDSVDLTRLLSKNKECVNPVTLYTNEQID